MGQEEIAELDRWWIAFVYFAPRDKYGQLKVRAKPREGRERKLSARDAWVRTAETKWGYPDWYARKVYDAMMVERAKVKPVVDVEQPIIVSAMTGRMKRV